MTQIVYEVTDPQGTVRKTTTKAQAEELKLLYGGSYEMKYIEEMSSWEAYCKPLTRFPGSRT